ncbi:MAG: DNA polymerase III subunit epsilon [Fimbriimonadaceae bacterium]|nr:DNA polymerase III subunit epsilon [Alphaproteobacteria bacterium]
MREIVLDTETTGLDPATGDRIVEIGCVELINHIPTGNVWHEYINPARDMPEGAFAVHGLSEEFLSDKPLFVDLADSFLEFVAQSDLIIHNAAFDIAFLNAELATISRGFISMSRVIDTLGMARRRNPGGQNSLDALCRKFAIDNSKRTKHGALLDAELLAEVYLELIGGRQTGLSLEQADSASSVAGISAGGVIGPRPTPRANTIDIAELASHQSALLKLGEDAIWRKYAKKLS